MNKFQFDGLEATITLGQARFPKGDPIWTNLHHINLLQYIWLQLSYPAEEIVYTYVRGMSSLVMGPTSQEIQKLAGFNELKHNADKEMCKSLRVALPSKDALERVDRVEKLAIIFETMYFGPHGAIGFAKEPMSRKYFEQLVQLFPEHGDKLAEYYVTCTQQEPPAIWLQGDLASQRQKVLEVKQVVVHALPKTEDEEEPKLLE